ncbi:hypothetical protein GCM10009576_033610 [Streptomyces rhizosphaericus]|uniref:Uncharacterized protein n=2 Tax=Streptomyces rhizosphaericus TaxID=114699 RepID=A0ABN1S8V2_9ACTN
MGGSLEAIGWCIFDLHEELAIEFQQLAFTSVEFTDVGDELAGAVNSMSIAAYARRTRREGAWDDCHDDGTGRTHADRAGADRAA